MAEAQVEYVELAEHLEQLMYEKGFDRKSLAGEAGVNIHMIHNILQSKVKDPPASKTEALAKVLGVSTHFLLNGIKKIDSEHDIGGISWDGILFSEAMATVNEISNEKLPNLEPTPANRTKLMDCANKVFRYALRSKSNDVDRKFAEFLIDEGFMIES